MLPMEDLPAVLLDLAVPHEDINELVALGRRFADEPELADLLERSVQALVREMGTVELYSELPPVPDGLGALRRWFPVFVCVAALPYTRAYHQERGIPERIARQTLADLGRHVAVHRRRYGTGGLSVPGWLRLHFRGEIYQLGRLHYQRAVLGDRMARAMRAAGLPIAAGDPCLSIHVPDFLGPLTPRACAESTALAREFFARHFPDEPCAVAVCHSWLLDPQLRSYLPADSNILRFQDLFRIGYKAEEPSDREPVSFVFGNPGLDPAALPQRTSVERAVAGHLLAGGHWHIGHGWFAL
ncbi:acyltransferase domain-containing protein [Streptomyces beijiangensis]|uniref:DUF5596 domain-containing protein n=1 Tax=Streptomyces beijiangensis TaxID=163361 RepID=A0A939JJG6_9ACTN|nr:acyltransferase domain-containing protein [Streptomyces beijiangensis]MBO0516558.1 DUF5596 domain-containing protein [Streptomyces beijiangensis]